MYNETLSRTITEATDKLFATIGNDPVFNCPYAALTNAQAECLATYFHEMEYNAEEKRFAADYIYNNLSNDHLYILDADDGYYYEELIPETTLLQNTNGNLFFYEGLDEDTPYHKVTLVEKCGDKYVRTDITCYLTEEELAQTTKVTVEMR